MQRGKKRAIKLHDTESEAKRHALNMDNCYVQHRKGSERKCTQYCQVNKICDNYKEKYNID